MTTALPFISLKNSTGSVLPNQQGSGRPHRDPPLDNFRKGITTKFSKNEYSTLIILHGLSVNISKSLGIDYFSLNKIKVLETNSEN
jgi:hypothetical protein